MASPVLSDKNKRQKRKNILIAGIIIFVFVTAMIYTYAKFVSTSSKQLAMGPSPVKSAISKPASASESGSSRKKDSAPLSANSPARLTITAHENEQKTQAIESGRSHIDSANALRDKKKTVAVEKAQPPKPKNAGSQKNSNAQPPPVQKTKAQIRRENLASLFSADASMPTIYKKLKLEVNQEVSEFYRTSVLKPELPTYTLTNLQEEVTPDDVVNVSSVAPPLPSSSQSPTSPTESDKGIMVYNVGENVVAEIRWKLVSDYNLPVFFDVIEPPLLKATFVGKFIMTPQQDGIVLKVNTLHYQGQQIPVNGYATDVKLDSSPLFDNNFDGHYTRRFLARASAAFMLPFIDFVANTSTTVTDGSVVVSNMGIDDTKDRIIGGMAGVAKEFLPDLRANSNIPPTITIPDGYVVGIVMVDPVYLPTELFDGDETTMPFKKLTNTHSWRN